MTKPLPIVLVLGLSLAACGAPEGPATKTAPAPAPPVAKTTPAPAPASTPASAPAAKPVDPMVAASALFQAQKYAEAATAFDAITRSQPTNGEAWYLLGLSLHLAGQLDQAIVAHTKASEFPKRRGDALYNLGCAQALKGSSDAAFEALNKALDSGFNNLKHMEADTDLKSLHADARYAALVERLKPKSKV